MAENNFDDTRSSMEKFIEIFNTSNPKNQFRDRQFEEDVLQVINRKSINNFELFAYSYDLIYDYGLSNMDDFVKYIEKQRNKDSNLGKAVKLYYSASNLDERDKTIQLALRIYQQHLRMVDEYQRLYDNSDNKISTIYNNIFDEDFYKQEYKYTDISFDVFLSHRYYLRFYNIIVFYILTVYFDLVVYVDWIFDHNVNRKKLSEKTVKLLKYRMNQSKKLVFFNILNSNTTNWMAWEVGYFSCLKENSIGILDLDGYCTGNKNVEVLSSNDTILFENTKGLFLEKTEQSINDWIEEIS